MQTHSTTLRSFSLLSPSTVLAFTLSAICPFSPAVAFAAAVPQATTAAAQADGAPFTADKLASLLPATVYFQGRTAPLQIRNSGGTAFNGDQVLWAGLVDTAGYSTSVQERYQFYFVSEGPIRFGDADLPAGAYGAGFLGDHFLIMDLGGHTLAQGPLQTDAAMKRPRPLQLLSDKQNTARLYLGRHYVVLQPGAKSSH